MKTKIQPENNALADPAHSVSQYEHEPCRRTHGYHQKNRPLPGMRHVCLQIPEMGGPNHLQGWHVLFLRRRQGYVQTYLRYGEIYAGKSAENIKDIYVTDYYEVELIDAKSAFYVTRFGRFRPDGS